SAPIEARMVMRPCKVRKKMHVRFSTIRKNGYALTLVVLLLLHLPAAATVYGNVRGIVHDAQHHPISDAKVTLQASDSAYKVEVKTNAEGEFSFSAVPLGKSSVTVLVPGFAEQSQVFTVVSGSAPVLHYQLEVASHKEEVTVTAAPEDLNPDSPRRDLTISQ